MSNSSFVGALPRAVGNLTWFRSLASLIYAIVMLCVLGEQAAARTLYVDAKSAGGNGAVGAPFQSISQAASRARPGDTVLVHRGVYTGQVKIHSSGRVGAPIVIKGEPGAIINGANAREVDTLVEITGNHLIFEGFQVQNASRTGIGLWGTFDVVVRNNVIVGSRGAGIWAGHDRRGKSGRNIIEKNRVYNNCLMNRARNRNSGWPVGIAIAVSDGSIVRENRVHENYGEGIGVLSSVGVQVYGNVVYDNFSVNIYLDNAPRTLVRANLIGSTGSRRFFRHRRPSAGVLIANEATRHPMPSREITVVRNTLVGVEDVYYGTYGVNSGLHASVLAPNRVEPSNWFVPPVAAPGT